MLFLVHFEITPEHRDASHKRLKAIGDGESQSVKVVGGPWHSVTQLEGWVVVEAEDAFAIGQLMHSWTDLNVNHVTPVLTDQEVLSLQQ